MDVKNMTDLNSGWILCPSKSFPGKLYYFNVLNGKAVWCLNENEKLKLDSGFNIPKANKYFNCEEPISPPSYSPTNNIGNILPNTWPDNIYNRTYQYPYPAAPAANYQQFVPYVGWSPIQQQFWPNISPDLRRPDLGIRLDTVNESHKLDNEFFVQSSGIPLSKRFINYESPSIIFNKENKIINKLTTPTLLKHSNSSKTESQTLVSKYIAQSPEVFFNENSRLSTTTSNCQTKSDLQTEICAKNSKQFFSGEGLRSTMNMSQLSFNDSPNTRMDLPKNKIPKYIRENSVPTPQTILYNNSQNPLEKKGINMNSYSESNNILSNNINVQEKHQQNLSNNDLRLVLLAKKRKSQTDGITDDIKTKRHKLQETVSQTKKVTFNLDNLDFDDEDYETDLQTSTYTNSNALEHEEQPISDVRVNTHQQNTNDDMSMHTLKINNLAIEEAQDYDTDTSRKQTIVLLKNHHEKIAPAKADQVHYIPTSGRNAFNNTNSKQDHDVTSNAIENCIPIYNNVPKCNNKAAPEYNEPRNDFFRTKFTLNNSNIDTQIKRTVNNTEINKVDVVNTSSKYLNIHIMENNIFPKSNSLNTKVSPTTDMNTILHTNRENIWYLVVDVDILLNHQSLIDELIKSDDKCRLLIPHAVRTEIESICLGDCCGQQRVMVARQMSRKMSGSHKQIIVEPIQHDDKPLNTKDNILKCCVRAIEDNYFVLLITNNSCLIYEARRLKIRCYSSEDIRNGAIIKPEIFLDLKRYKLNAGNKKMCGNTLLSDKTCSANNITSDMFNVKEGKNKNFDFLINITNPKTRNTQNISKVNLNAVKYKPNNEQHLKDTENAAITRNINNQKPNILNSMELSRTMTLHALDNHEVNTCRSPTKKSKALISNYHQSKKALVRQDISLHSKNNREKYNYSIDVENDFDDFNGDTDNTAIKHNVTLMDKTKPRVTQRDKIIISNLAGPDNVTRKTCPKTDHVQSTSRKFLEDRLKEYCVPNVHVHHKIRTRIIEYICCFTQIMEELYNGILQNKMQYMNKLYISSVNTVECLTCIEMLYDNENLKIIIEILAAVLTRCTCDKGKIKTDTDPRDMMKMIGCGILLVQTLKKILPNSVVLVDCESYFESLINSIKCSDNDLDFNELLKTECRCEHFCDKEIGQYFLKDNTYILEYLNKHFEEGANVDIVGEYLKNNEMKVIRMTGKHINSIKIDKNKNISYIAEIDNLNNTGKTKMSRNKEKKDLDANLMRYQEKSQVVNSQQRLPKQNSAIDRKVEHFGQDKSLVTDNNIRTQTITNFRNTKSNSRYSVNSDFAEYSTHENTFFQNKKENEPKMIINLKPIDKYEEKIKNKEPKSLMDNSVANFKTLPFRENIHESIVDDKYSEKNIDSDDKISIKSIILSSNKTSYKNDDYSSFNGKNAGTVIHKINSDDPKTTEICGFKNYHNSNCNTDNNDAHISKAVHEDRHKSFNKSINENQENNIDYRHSNNDMNNEYDISEHFEECSDGGEGNNNEIKTEILDYSTNDSGFENDSTQAHNLVKTFLNELSFTFKTMYKFIYNFTIEINKGTIHEHRKNTLYNEASKVLKDVRLIMQQLKGIEERESNKGSILKYLLLRAGVEAASDKKITRYRQIVMKCLEQAQIFESAIRVIIYMTGDLKDVPDSSNSLCYNMSYVNIFE